MYRGGILGLKNCIATAENIDERMAIMTCEEEGRKTEKFDCLAA